MLPLPRISECTVGILGSGPALFQQFFSIPGNFVVLGGHLSPSEYYSKDALERNTLKCQQCGDGGTVPQTALLSSDPTPEVAFLGRAS